MSKLKKIFSALMALVILAVAALAIPSDASARGHHGGHHQGEHEGRFARHLEDHQRGHERRLGGVSLHGLEAELVRARRLPVEDRLEVVEIDDGAEDRSAAEPAARVALSRPRQRQRRPMMLQQLRRRKHRVPAMANSIRAIFRRASS